VAEPRLTYLTEDEKQRIHEMVLHVLSDVGVAYNSSRAIDLLAEAGVEVDRQRLTARLTWDVIEPCLSTVPTRVLLAGRDPAKDVVLGGERLVVTSDGMATYVYDDATGDRHAGTSYDLAEMMRLLDALDEVDTVWPSPQAGDLDAVTQALEMNAICLRNTVKHIQDEVRVPAMVSPMLAIYEAAIGASLRERPVFSVTNCTIAPLQHDAEMTDAGIELCRRGVPIFVLPMPQAGTTGPLSVLGTCVVDLAELLSAVVLFQLAQPGCALIGGVGAAVAEMRSGSYLAGSPEIGLINAICLEMSRFYGLPTQATGVSGDAKACNYQAGAEGMMSGLAAALAGADSLIAVGTLDAVQSQSLAKMVLDCETVGMIRRFLRRQTVDDGEALLADVADVGVGGHFLACRSTRQRRRTEIWPAGVLQRGPFEEYRERPLVADALARARELLEAHSVPPLAEDAEREIAGILAAVRRGQ
jgi:trimethylamine---corrinoid protein Co-methyltransferase